MVRRLQKGFSFLVLAFFFAAFFSLFSGATILAQVEDDSSVAVLTEDSAVVDTAAVDTAAEDTVAAAGTEEEEPMRPFFIPHWGRVNALILVLAFSTCILLYTRWARQGKPMYLRKIPGLNAVEEAVGRATEMGRPVLFIPGIAELDEIETIAGISILGRVAKITAQYETPLRVPVRYPLVLAAGQEVVEQSYIEMGKKDAYDKDCVRYVAGEQFAFTATVNGYMMRERPAANIYMGAFFAESLLLAETGNAAGSIQIAGTARPEQLPFFIAACDYTLMGEELYAGSAYLSREPVMTGGLKGQDFIKMLIAFGIIIGVVLASFGYGETFIGWFKEV
jgi:hypothetical protein